MDLKDGLTIFYIIMGIGGVMGGILTKINNIRFVSKKDFAKRQSECQTNLCGKIDAVKETVNSLKDTVEENATESQKRRERDKTELTKHLMEISKFMGAVENHMKKD